MIQNTKFTHTHIHVHKIKKLEHGMPYLYAVWEHSFRRSSSVDYFFQKRNGSFTISVSTTFKKRWKQFKITQNKSQKGQKLFALVGTWTLDPAVKSRVLYRLSYKGLVRAAPKLVLVVPTAHSVWQLTSSCLCSFSVWRKFTEKKSSVMCISITYSIYTNTWCIACCSI